MSKNESQDKGDSNSGIETKVTESAELALLETVTLNTEGIEHNNIEEDAIKPSDFEDQKVGSVIS